MKQTTLSAPIPISFIRENIQSDDDYSLIASDLRNAYINQDQYENRIIRKKNIIVASDNRLIIKDHFTKLV